MAYVLAPSGRYNLQYFGVYSGDSGGSESVNRIQFSILHPWILNISPSLLIPPVQTASGQHNGRCISSRNLRGFVSHIFVRRVRWLSPYSALTLSCIPRLFSIGTSIAYAAVRSDKSDTNWLLINYEVRKMSFQSTRTAADRRFLNS